MVARGGKEVEPKVETTRSRKTQKAKAEEYSYQSDEEEMVDGRMRRVAVKKEKAPRRDDDEAEKRSSRHTRGNDPTRGSHKRISSAPPTVTSEKESRRKDSPSEETREE